MTGEVGVYRIVHHPSGREYIGQSINLGKRWSGHRRLLARGLHHSPRLQRAWDRDGESAFGFELLVACAEDMLTTTEQRLIDELNPAFNVAKVAGSTRGVIPSVETRAKMSAVRKGRTLSSEHRRKISLANRGQRISDEQRQQLSQAHKGKIIGPGQREKLRIAKLGTRVSSETRARMKAAALRRWERDRAASL